MKFLDQISRSALEVKEKVSGLYEKIQEDQDERYDRYSYCNIDAKNDMLRSTLKFSTYAPLIVYSYILLYGLYSCYTIIKVIILAPIQVIMGMLNIASKSLKLYKSRYVTMHSLVVVAVAYIFTLDEDIFDISFMYHLIRGQSTVKVYAIIFAIQSSEIVLTKLGIFLYQNIKQKLTNKEIPFYKLFPQFVVQSLYVFVHAYIIYIDFLIYSVVLNSSLQSFIIFWSVVYLTKMKGAPSFGLDINKYKLTLTDDSKYRLSRIIFLVLFLCNQVWDSIPSMGYKLFFILVVEEIFIITKHLLYLLSSYRGSSDTSALEIRQDMYKTMYLNHEKSSVDRCIMQNFTALPFSIFVIKIFSIIIQSNWETNFLAYFTFYVVFCIIAGILITLIISIKSIEQLAQKIRKQHEQNPNPFINSICIDVIGRIIETAKKNEPKTTNHEESKIKTSQFSPFKRSINKKSSLSMTQPPVTMKRAPSFFESLLLHADQIKREKQKDDNKQDKVNSQDDILQDIDIINEQSNLNESRTSKKSHVELRKMESQM